MDFGPDVEVSETYSRALLDAVIAGTPTWIRRAMTAVIAEQRGSVSTQDQDKIDSAVESVVRTVRMRLSQLLSLDADDQDMNPLAVLRGSTSAATEALREMGLHEVQRDEFERTSSGKSKKRIIRESSMAGAGVSLPNSSVSTLMFTAFGDGALKSSCSIEYSMEMAVEIGRSVPVGGVAALPLAWSVIPSRCPPSD